MRMMASPAGRKELAQIHREREAVITSREHKTPIALACMPHKRRTRMSHFFERMNKRIMREVTLP